MKTSVHQASANPSNNPLTLFDKEQEQTFSLKFTQSAIYGKWKVFCWLLLCCASGGGNAVGFHSFLCSYSQQSTAWLAAQRWQRRKSGSRKDRKRIRLKRYRRILFVVAVKSISTLLQTSPTKHTTTHNHRQTITKSHSKETRRAARRRTRHGW